MVIDSQKLLQTDRYLCFCWMCLSSCYRKLGGIQMFIITQPAWWVGQKVNFWEETEETISVYSVTLLWCGRWSDSWQICIRSVRISHGGHPPPHKSSISSLSHSRLENMYDQICLVESLEWEDDIKIKMWSLSGSEVGLTKWQTRRVGTIDMLDACWNEILNMYLGS